MKAGFLIVLAFSALWGEVALLTAGLRNAALVLPVLISAVLAFYGAGRFQPKLSSTDGGRIWKLVGRWSALQGAAIFLAAQVLGRMGRPALIAPVIAVIVGLHFIPLARGIPRTKYYVTAASLVAAGLIAMALPRQIGPTAASAAAALILWATAISLLADARRLSAVAA